MTQLVCLGISHHTASVELREYLSGPVLHHQRHPAVRALAVLATCNRVELYAEVDDDHDAYELLVRFLSRVHHMAPANFLTHTYFYRDVDVATHLCRVAAGLDSQILGEPQILGQVTSAYEQALAAHTTGPMLTRLFHAAIRAGKRARSETTISTNPASISSVAVTLAQKVCGDLRSQRILVIGLGEMGELAITALRSRGVTQIDLANRTVSKAVQRAAAWGGQGYGLAELPMALVEADLVFSATSAGQPIITPDLLAEVMRLRGDAPLTLIDLAVPRDIDPAVASLPGVRCFDMDDLRANLDDALSLRQQAVPQVNAIIAEEVADWQQQVQALVVKPHIVALRQKAEHIRQKELARALRFLGDVDPQTRDQLEHLTQSLVNSLLHEPTVNLKALAAEPDVDDIVVTFRTLFKLDDECSSPVTVRTHSSQAGH